MPPTSIEQTPSSRTASKQYQNSIRRHRKPTSKPGQTQQATRKPSGTRTPWDIEGGRPSAHACARVVTSCTRPRSHSVSGTRTSPPLIDRGSPACVGFYGHCAYATLHACTGERFGRVTSAASPTPSSRAPSASPPASCRPSGSSGSSR